MREHPILFSGEMVRAILDGRKTQTRRVIKGLPKLSQGFSWEISDNTLVAVEQEPIRFESGPEIAPFCECPYQVSDLLYVRESFYFQNWLNTSLKEKQPIEYAAEISDRMTVEDYKLAPSIHMPKWAARLWLKIIDVRVERVQDISGADAEAEGVIDDDWITWREEAANITPPGSSIETPKDKFENFWNSIYGKGEFNWDANPWAWVLKFERV